MSQLGLNLNLPATLAPPPRTVRGRVATAAPPVVKPAPAPLVPHHFTPDPLMQETELGPDVEIGTSIAARLLGVSPRTIRAYCDEDVLREGAHWRRNSPTRPYLIRRRAIIAKKLAWF